MNKAELLLCERMLEAVEAIKNGDNSPTALIRLDETDRWKLAVLVDITDEQRATAVAIMMTHIANDLLGKVHGVEIEFPEGQVA